MRGVVDRDKYNPGMMLSMPSREFGTRLAKQLKKFAMGVAIYYELNSVDDKVMEIVERVALGSVPDKVERVVAACSGGKEVKSDLIVAKSGMTRSTIYRVLQDLAMLKVLRQPKRGLWILSNDVHGLIQEAGAYNGMIVRSRSTRVKRKIVRRK
jgi:hypothetical protein